MKSTKSQAALEFLTTYGWAVLIILIMIGTLAYFGVFNPSRVLPNRCTFGTEFQCIDFKISDDGTGEFRLRLKNAVGELIEIDSITLTSDSNVPYDCTTVDDGALSPWPSGGSDDLAWSDCNTATAGFISGSKAKVGVIVRYYAVTSGSAYTKEVQGEVYSTVT